MRPILRLPAAGALGLGLALALPTPVVGQDGGAEGGTTGGESVAVDAIPTGQACDYPVDLLWHREPKDAPWQMGVSVVNKTSGQQVPGLGTENFQVVLDDGVIERGDGFEVRQSANAFMMVPEDGEETPAELGVDPVSYDVYFAVDMTASMADVVEREGMKPTSKLTWSLKVIQNLVKPPGQGQSSLFDERDRVYISGFTSKLETGFMTSTSADRDKITRALSAINEFQPTDESAALYASILHNLTNITAQAGEYKDPAKKREAVLIVMTDSFNGMDLEGRRALRYCNKNDELTDAVQQAILDAQQATDSSLKVYLLGMGVEGEAQYYSLSEPPSRRCRINTVEREVLDARSFRVLGNPELTRGGFVGSNDPIVLLKFVKGQFEALKSAYEVTYKPKEGTGKPRKFQVVVSIGEGMCLDQELISSNIIPQAVSDAETSASEVALFLAGLIIAFFFVPRSLVNLANLGGGESAPKPRKRGKGKGKKRRRR